ncbi:SRPBCC family protein [Kitasatospora sp. NBC_01246]|uniref:SRPBCC family protein n=1 Tax=Kitasatospora sp. NBC_01246 TaxID=2903570 RepID=UPI002E34AF8D|nr:SRPBCC family protein [Kitasatospora sp. NBC_01246]
MTSSDDRRTTIEADPALPVIRIVREFDAPPARVFRAWTEPELVARWLGPRDRVMKIDTWDARTGGSYRYSALAGDGAGDGAGPASEVIASFYGSFHEVRRDSRLVQTFTFEGVPDGVSLETVVFEPVGEGRTRVSSLSLVDSLATRDAIMASGMDRGVIEGYAQLDELLAAG